MRRRLSTILTPFWRLFTAAWILYFSLVSLYGAWKLLTTSNPPFGVEKFIGFIIFALVSSVFAHFMGGSLKSVYLEGDTLLVSNYLKKIEIPLSQIRHVDGPDWSSLGRITLLLREPSAFGDEIIFAAGFFDAGEIAKELKDRAEFSAGEGVR